MSKPYTAADHRAAARAVLGGRIFHKTWLMALVVMLVYSVLLNFAASFSAGILMFVLYGPLMFGVATVFLRLARTGEVRLEDLFDGGFKKDIAGNILLGLMTLLYTFLWSLLLIIPGIVKSYAYSMAFYIMHDNPTWSWQDCLDESQRIMNGNKWALFCLDFSFIGWSLLCLFTCGIGTLWLAPYTFAARTDFYESIKNAQ